MIKANELRIGNQLSGGVVVGIEKDYFIIYDGYQKWRSDKMVQSWIEEQPIPLTEEQLLKFGILDILKYGTPTRENSVHLYDGEFWYVIEFTGDNGYGDKSYSSRPVNMYTNYKIYTFALPEKN